MTDPAPKSPFLPAVAVRLAAAWILAGALFKLLQGTPNDLPAVIQDLPLELGLTYKLAIAAELALSVLAILRPRLAWPLLTIAYLVFEYVLYTQISAGEAECGCFGSKIPLKPKHMVSIDSALLILMLISRPWRLRGGAKLALVVPLMALGASLPWILDREATAPRDREQGAVSPATGEGASTDATGVSVKQSEPKAGTKAASDPKSEGLPEYVILSMDDMQGKLIDDTKLADWLEDDVSTLPIDGLWVLWRWTCSHCAEHLEYLANNPPDVPFLTLVRLKEEIDSETNREVYTMPMGANVIETSLPAEVEWVIQTPAEIELEAGIVVRAEDGVETPGHQ